MIAAAEETKAGSYALKQKEQSKITIVKTLQLTKEMHRRIFQKFPLHVLVA